MHLKIKKRYFLYLFVITLVVLLVWSLMRSNSFTDTCSMELNVCLLKSKTEGFFFRMCSGVSCVIKNLVCSVSAMF